MLRWCAKFEDERDSPALVWKKGRNQHARALLCGLRTGRLAAPFDTGPPDEPLGAGLPAACASAVGLNSSVGSSGRTMRPEAKQQQRQQQRQRQRLVVPGTESLRLAPPQLPPPPHPQAEEAKTAAAEDESSASLAFARAQLPSRVELAASLGAAAERIAELEWRLGERERRARAREWGASVAAAARASAALLAEEGGGEEERREGARLSLPASAPPRVVAEVKRLPPSPPPLPKRRGGAVAAAEASAGTASAAAGTGAPPRPPLSRSGPKESAARPVATPPQRRKETPIPSVSLEELSRRISALAPQN